MLALTKVMKLVNTARTERDALMPVQETLFLVALRSCASALGLDVIDSSGS
ncbi:MAG: hypothetical protein QOF56_3506 [Acidobacteriaceae bacterium]|nr:hypothetical protein [Acidobacteriaceae bacterium]